MNDKLTIKELAAYLPWEVEVRYKDCMSGKYKKALLTGINKLDIETTYKRKINGCVGDIISFKGNNNIDDLNFKILLLPLSHLTKEIEHKGEKFVPVERWGWFGENFNIKYFNHANFKPNFEPYYKTEQMLACHFDVFRLIERGLVIDKTTIQ